MEGARCPQGLALVTTGTFPFSLLSWSKKPNYLKATKLPGKPSQPRREKEAEAARHAQLASGPSSHLVGAQTSQSQGQASSWAQLRHPNCPRAHRCTRPWHRLLSAPNTRAHSRTPLQPPITPTAAPHTLLSSTGAGEPSWKD